MNIFALDNDPIKAAQMMCDKHILKMILETRQLILLAILTSPGITWEVPPYISNSRYRNHPCTKWARATHGNLTWLFKHGKALCDEYTYRYGKVHKYTKFFDDIPNEPTLEYTSKILEQTPFVQCMLPEYFDDDPVVAYRNYYLGAKTHLLKYTRRTPPDWMQDMQLGEHRDNATI